MSIEDAGGQGSDTGVAAEPKKPRLHPGAFVAVAAFVAAGTGLLLWWTQREPEPSLLTPRATVGSETHPERGGEESPAHEVSPVDASAEERPEIDGTALLRSVARNGSKSALVAGWFESDGIMKRLIAATRLIAIGRSPRSVVDFIQVPGHFTVVESWQPEAKGRLPEGVSPDDKDRIFVAPESFARYDAIAEAIDGADVEAWGQGYRALRPHLEKTFAEVAASGESFDGLLRSAISRLTRVEIPDGQPELTASGAIFSFKDPKLESLGDAEKHLLRMGPANARKIQRALSRFAASAGLTDTR